MYSIQQHYFTISESQESENGLIGWFWLWVSHEIVVKTFDVLIGLKDLLSNLLMLAEGFNLLLHGPLLRTAHTGQLSSP